MVKSVVRFTLSAAALLGLAFAPHGLASAAEEEPQAEIQHDYYAMVNDQTGKCWDIYQRSWNNDARIVQFDCAELPSSRQWYLEDRGNGEHAIRSKMTDKCVDIYQQNNGNDVGLVQYDCHYAPSQRWTLQPSSVPGHRLIRNVQSGRCVDVFQRSSDNNVPIVQYDCHGASSERWLLASV
ncbi:RICIN domain-containing protein [Saccharothrix coeruleofusca]|uniref:Ricin B lectin domain-containing protein n=1 Tax=Saccharothrix coeruleofusca TaxID=33919 RepID=A0A918AW64_9PSEU|nr:RICIN domain-containing protein [Saccharothrix coeruleofusca]MBP2337006.1 hypothetical protein [Saccharothrix coeruleofusca]GGP83873.1 hypothetical protein GCM10010185_67190 [Saccharothrix coeruleofusca]